MAPKVTVLKVSITCDKCKVKLLKAVAGLEGVNKIEADNEKGTLTVAGVADPHEIISCARKVGPAEIVSIADPKKPEEKKPEEKKPAHTCPQPCYCKGCCPNNYVVLPFDMPAGPYPYPDQPTCNLM